MLKDLDSWGINSESGSFYDAKFGCIAGWRWIIIIKELLVRDWRCWRVLALQGYYDGQKIQTLETIQVEKNQKVIITVLDEFVEEMPVRKGRSARGLLSEYADTGLWEKEKTAWEKAVAENMQMLDTNMVLRYLLNDNREMADEAETIIKEGSVLLTTASFLKNR